MAKRPASSPDGLAALTRREGEVLRLTARGLRSAEIAVELGITVPTVKRHLTTIYRKLAVDNRVEATVRYFAAVRTPGEKDVLVQQLEHAVGHLVSLGLLRMDRARGVAEPAPSSRLRQWTAAAKGRDGEEQLRAALEAVARAMTLATAPDADRFPASR
jgi:DNA-binding CsgD family transcriptional regulator